MRIEFHFKRKVLTRKIPQPKALAWWHRWLEFLYLLTGWSRNQHWVPKVHFLRRFAERLDTFPDRKFRQVWFRCCPPDMRYLERCCSSLEGEIHLKTWSGVDLKWLTFRVPRVVAASPDQGGKERRPQVVNHPSNYHHVVYRDESDNEKRAMPQACCGKINNSETSLASGWDLRYDRR